MVLILLAVLSIIGMGLQQLFVKNTGAICKGSLGSAVFIGLGLLLHVMNALQYLDLPLAAIMVLIPFLVLGFKPTWYLLCGLGRTELIAVGALVLLLVLDCVLLAPELPLISWDSWLGWELKAKQWMAHGWSVNLLEGPQWLSEKAGIYSSTAHYPDGLPLIYFLFKSVVGENTALMGYFYVLCFYIVALLLVIRLKEQGADTMFLVWSVLLLVSMPLLNNHIRLQGYADIWMAMVLLLSVWALSDWNQNKTPVNLLRLVVFLSMLPLFKIEGWVWLSLLLMAQIFSKLLIRRHRWYVLFIVVLVASIWFGGDNWSFSWSARTVVISQDYLKVGSLFDLSLMPVDVSTEIIAGLFLQNNWGLLWFFMPFVLSFWLLVKHPKHQQVTQTFFVLSFTAFLFLFFFTDASKWAENYTAVNRIVLQLTPVFAYLVMQVFMTWQQKRVGEPTLEADCS